MPTPMTANQAQSVSSNANVKYLWSTYLGECEDPVLGAWVDPLTLDIEYLLDCQKDMAPYQTTDKKKITTVSYELYGTTSMWAVILYLNGFMHPDEIPPGIVLLVPSLSAIDRIKASSNKITSPVGQSFVV